MPAEFRDPFYTNPPAYPDSESAVRWTPSGVDQPPYGGDAYPFIDPPEDTHGLFADLHFTVRAADVCPVGPFRVTNLANFGTLASRPDMIIEDESGGVTVNTASAAYTTRTWGPSKTVHVWSHVDFHVAAVQHVPLPPWRSDPFSDHIGVDSVLDIRTGGVQPRRLLGIRVNDVDLAGTIDLQSGYNADLAAGDVDPDALVRVSTITVDGVPKAGIGLYPACSDAPGPITSINQSVVGEDIRVTADACFRVQRPIAIIGADDNGARIGRFGADGLTDEQAKAAIVLYDDCRTCRPCSAYENTYRALYRTWTAWREAAEAAEAVRDAYSEARDRWLAERECRLAHTTYAVVTPEPACRTFIGASFCNAQDICLDSGEIRIVIETYNDGSLRLSGGDPRVVKAYVDSGKRAGERPAAVGSAAASSAFVLSIPVGSVGPQATATARLRLSDACEDTDSVIVHVSFHADAVVGQSLPAVTLPADVLAAHAAAGFPATPALGYILKAAPRTPDATGVCP